MKRSLVLAAVPMFCAALTESTSAQVEPPNDTSEMVEVSSPRVIEALFLMPIAPAAVVLLIDKPAPEYAFPPLGFWSRPLAATIMGGVALAYSDDETWAYSASVEMLIRGIYVEARNEHFRLPEHYEYRTIRAGYFLHPVPEAAGGITIGYRDARGIAGHSGLEVGFPFITGAEHWWLRYEAAYVMSRTPSWNYRFHAEKLLGDGPFYVGLNVEGKTLPLREGSKVASIPIVLSVGVRQ